MGRLIRVCVILAVACGLMWLVYTNVEGQANRLDNQETILSHLQSDEQGLQFTLTTPSFLLTQAHQVEVKGLEQRIQQPGAPALPYYTTFIALPSGAQAIVTIEEANVTSKAVALLAPAPQPASSEQLQLEARAPDAFLVADDEPLRQERPAPAYEPDATIYQHDAAFPRAQYAVSEPMYYRDVRLVLLQLYPVQYNPVTGIVRQAQQLHVSVSFAGTQPAGLPLSTLPDAYPSSLEGLILNSDQVGHWRSLPPAAPDEVFVRLPAGVETYKIEVSQDGIYEISGADLKAAGMNIAGVNPNAIRMIYRGEPVAYQFVGNSNQVLEENEKIRFYGWVFAGPRSEKQFVTNNVFWLWVDPGHTPGRIGTSNNQAGASNLTPVTSYRSTITEEPEHHFFSTWTNRWENFPNEPDAWYWDYITQTTPAPLTKTYQINLPHPVTSGANATYVVEVLSREDSRFPTPYTYVVRAAINDSAYQEASWRGLRNVNITGTVAASQLKPMSNDVNVVFATDTSAGAGGVRYYLNRVTVEYTRQLAAVDNQLIFDTAGGGTLEFRISGFSQSNPANVHIWNITSPRQPVQINTLAPTADGGTFTYRAGGNYPAGSHFIATANVLSGANALKLSRYVPPDMNPAQGADWLAITHKDFRAQANRLAGHRASTLFGSLKTYVVDIDDVINQYGYGLPLPEAIRNYLAHTFNWQTTPRYVLLLGDATINPRGLNCLSCRTSSTNWDETAKTYVLTDLVFEDRFQGLIPSDHTFVTLIGNDLLPDMAIGRIPAETATEARRAVDKIILYEQNQLRGANWLQNVLFVSDDDDPGGSFCSESAYTGSFLPGRYHQTHLCLPYSYPDRPTITQTAQLRNEMRHHVNNVGVSILNYRGHGSIQVWASPPILSTEMTDFWANFDKPVVILSADCLDGHFAWPGMPALSETFLLLDGTGSAAHWSSTGLGYTYEHTVLHTAFYDAVFEGGLTAIGDVINYAKMKYYQGGYHKSEMYAFTLQGDPAMRVFWLDANSLFLPVVNRP